MNHSSPTFFAAAIHAIEKFHRALPKSLRIRIQRWVEKLVGSGGNSAYVRHRDAYTKLMLNMILKRKLEEPFHKMPPDGQLPPFPTHLKILLKPPFGQEENEFWHQVIARVHEEASVHKDISTDTAVHGSRIANNSSIHGIARSPYHHELNEESAGTAIKSAMHHTTMGHRINVDGNEEMAPGVVGRGGVGAGVAGVMDVETPTRATPGKRSNHVVFSESKGAGAGAGMAREMGGPTPSKYGGLNHSSFVGGDAPERRWQHGAGADESKREHHQEDKSAASFWRQEPSMNIGGPVRHQPVGSAEYSRVYNQVKSSNPHLPDGDPALRALVREQQVRIAILEEQLRTMSVQYEQFVDKIEKQHAAEIARLKGNADGVDTSATAGTGEPASKGPEGGKPTSATSKQLFPSNNESMQAAGVDSSLRSSIDFARDYLSVDFDHGEGEGVTAGVIGDPDASMVGAGYPKLSASPSRSMGKDRGHHHIHISSPPGKLTSKLPQSPIGQATHLSLSEKFDIKSRPPPPPFPMSLLLHKQENKAIGEESSPNLAATVQTQRWVNLSREGL